MVFKITWGDIFDCFNF